MGSRGGSLIPHPVVLLVTVSHSWYYVSLRWMSFEMDASAFKSLVLDTSTEGAKEVIREVQRLNPQGCLV